MSDLLVAEQPAPFVEASLEDLVHDLTKKQIEVRAAKSRAGKARKAVQDLVASRDGLLDEIMRRDAQAHNMELPFDDGDEEPEEDDGD